jgi:two-component system CheB/CheR fusion protein
VRLSDDLSNLLSGVEIPIIMLGLDRCIRRFAPMTQKALNLIPGDIGRPIHDLKLNIDLPELDQWITDVIDNVRTVEREVQNRAGHWYFLRMRPYKTAENKIDGVLMSFVDIDGLKRSLDDAREARNLAEATVETVRVPLIVLDSRLRVVHANRSFYRYFKTLPVETENKLFYELGSGQWNIPRLRELLEQILPRDSQFEGFEMEHEFPGIGYRKIVLNGRQVRRDDQGVNMILLAIEDITERRPASVA